MTDYLDSRAIRHTDCFGQRFMRVGTYRYGLVQAGTPRAFAATPFTIEVVETADTDRGDPSAMQQHLVEVRAEATTLTPDADPLTIAAGDLVTWHCAGAARLPFAVVGEKDFFDSHRLVNECGFSHAFAVAGEYRWVDAYGSRLTGVVRVSDPKAATDQELAAWKRQLSQGTLVMINDDIAEPAEVEILTGQTVYFAVISSQGVSVTDARITASRDLAPLASTKTTVA